MISDRYGAKVKSVRLGEKFRDDYRKLAERGLADKRYVDSPLGYRVKLQIG
jgi:hypothetical protein